MTSSSLIKFCVLVGQDCRSLGALIVPDPEALKELEESEGEGCLVVTTYCLHSCWPGAS